MPVYRILLFAFFVGVLFAAGCDSAGSLAEEGAAIEQPDETNPAGNDPKGDDLGEDDSGEDDSGEDDSVDRHGLGWRGAPCPWFQVVSGSPGGLLGRLKSTCTPQPEVDQRQPDMLGSTFSALECDAPECYRGALAPMPPIFGGGRTVSTVETRYKAWLSTFRHRRGRIGDTYRRSPS